MLILMYVSVCEESGAGSKQKKSIKFCTIMEKKKAGYNVLS